MDQEHGIIETFLALADEVNESEIERHFEKTEELLENESSRTELNIFVQSNAVWKSKETGHRMLSVLLHSFIVQPTTSTAHAICHLIMKSHKKDSSNDLANIHSIKEELIADASTILVEELQESSNNWMSYYETFFEVARSPMTDSNRTIFIPALVLANHLYKNLTQKNDNLQIFMNNTHETDELWGNNVLEALGKQLFALDVGCAPIFREEINLMSPLIDTASAKQLAQSFATPIMEKSKSQLEATLETFYNFLSSFKGDQERKGDFIQDYLKPPTDLIAIILNDITNANHSANAFKTSTLLVEILKASPYLATEKVFGMLESILMNSFDGQEFSKRRALYSTYQYLAEYFSSREYVDVDICKFPQKQNLKRDFCESTVSTLTNAIEKEEESEEMDEDCISAAHNVSELWTDLQEKLNFETKPSPKVVAVASHNNNLTQVENDNLIKSRAKLMTNTTPVADLLGKSPKESDDLIKSRSKMEFDKAPPTVGVVFENNDLSNKINNKLLQHNTNMIQNSDENRINTKSNANLFPRPDPINDVQNSVPTYPSSKKTQKTSGGTHEEILPFYDKKDSKGKELQHGDLMFDVKDDKLASYTPYGGDVIESHGLVTATLVEEESYDAPIRYAQTYVEKVPYYKNRRVMTYVVGLIVVIVIIVAGTSLFATKKVIDKNLITESPSAAPSAPPTSSRDAQGLWERISELTGPDILLARNGDFELQKRPQYLAANWIINVDKRQLSVSDDLLEQRFVLALIYFATDGDNWNDCSYDPNQIECTYTDVFYKTNFTESRYLSEAHECEWFQTYCSKDNVVRELLLYGNNLSGPLPTEIGVLSKLRRLRLNSNNLVGTLPTEIGRFNHLADMEIHANNFVGTLPEEIFNVDTLQLLNVAMNGFEGPIPDKFDNLKNLKGIHLFENSFTGTIPETIGHMPYLSFIWLYKNKLTGTIPTSIFKNKRMKQMLLYENQISGSLPAEIGLMKDLELLMLHDNKLNGTLPEEIYDLENLRWLYLQSNNFRGNILPKVNRLKNIKRLLFRRNEFSGSIPVEIGDLTKLEFLWFHYNNFEGDMPKQVCTLMDSNLGSLMADCLDEYRDASVDCECCTDCCDRDQETCYEIS